MVYLIYNVEDDLVMDTRVLALNIDVFSLSHMKLVKNKEFEPLADNSKNPLHIVPCTDIIQLEHREGLGTSK